MLIRKRVVLVAGAASVLLVGGGTAGAAIASGPVASGVIQRQRRARHRAGECWDEVPAAH
jgi:hypothetical protein